MKAQNLINETFLKKQLYLKDIFDFSNEELEDLKINVEAFLSQGIDRYEAFEKAFQKVFSSRKICRC